ncbi:hypothetical protein [Streptococcus mutans]|uniref:hypothetical protein n=1 Tax=Streptococcus mutans TaxID=1309 RepID=UPI0002EFFDD5|nr:hypothetical protein [Streptococcus mutans]
MLSPKLGRAVLFSYPILLLISLLLPIKNIKLIDIYDIYDREYFSINILLEK